MIKIEKPKYSKAIIMEEKPNNINTKIIDIKIIIIRKQNTAPPI